MTIFIATYATVALLAFQQLNVSGRHYYTAFITAFMIALAQYFFIKLAADSKSLYDVLVIGLGGGLGALTAMKIHDGFKGWRYAKNPKLRLDKNGEKTNSWEDIIKESKRKPHLMDNHNPSKSIGKFIRNDYDKHGNLIGYVIKLNDAGKKFVTELKGGDKNA